MKVSPEIRNFMIKVVAFATAFTVLYDFIKDLGEIIVNIYHFFGFAMGNYFLIMFFPKRRNNNE